MRLARLVPLLSMVSVPPAAMVTVGVTAVEALYSEPVPLRVRVPL